MAVAGRKPKPEGQAINRNKPIHDWLEVQNVPFEGESPDLPDDKHWSARSVRRWEVIRHLPHAALWHQGDWESALDYMSLLEEKWKEPTAELRIRERGLGLTTDSLRDLRIRYVEPTIPVESGNVTRIDAFRDL
jgi:hypothetical protein